MVLPTHRTYWNETRLSPDPRNLTLLSTSAIAGSNETGTAPQRRMQRDKKGHGRKDFGGFGMPGFLVHTGFGVFRVTVCWPLGFKVLQVGLLGLGVGANPTSHSDSSLQNLPAQARHQCTHTGGCESATVRSPFPFEWGRDDPKHKSY